jgi:hypothetical protein
MVRRRAGSYPALEHLYTCDEHSENYTAGGSKLKQAKLAKVFPSKCLVTTLTCLLRSQQSFVVGIFLNHRMGQWEIKWDLQLLTVPNR